MLGNPVGVISAGNSQSLERFLDLNYPLSILDVQRTMAVCAEDGAAAVILALSEETLNDDALQSVNVDVLGCDDKGLSEAEIVKAAQQRAGEIVSAAQTEARTVRQTVTDYCDNMLKTTEETMAENAAQVKNVRANLRQGPRKPALMRECEISR